jgi:hypothetical protein
MRHTSLLCSYGDPVGHIIWNEGYAERHTKREAGCDSCQIHMNILCAHHLVMAHYDTSAMIHQLLKTCKDFINGKDTHGGLPIVTKCGNNAGSLSSCVASQ